jgi:hypothetical protein
MYGYNGVGYDRLRSTIAQGLVVDVSRIQGSVAVTGPLTNTELRASNVGVTNTPISATQQSATWSSASPVPASISVNCAGMSTAVITLQLNVSGTFGSGTFNWDFSIDGIKWIAVPATRFVSLSSPTGQALSNGASISGLNPALFPFFVIIDVSGWSFVRLRMPSGTTSTSTFDVTLDAKAAPAVSQVGTLAATVAQGTAVGAGNAPWRVGII